MAVFAAEERRVRRLQFWPRHRGDATGASGSSSRLRPLPPSESRPGSLPTSRAETSTSSRYRTAAPIRSLPGGYRRAGHPLHRATAGAPELEPRSTIDFLRKQIATISTQLAESERKLETYRERYEVINPEAEATNQVASGFHADSARSVG